MDFRQLIDAFSTQSAQHWMQQANRYLPNALTWILSLAIAWFLARLIWSLVPVDTSFNWSAATTYTPNQSVAGQTTRIDFSAIAAAHLFGEADAEPVNDSAIDAPETQLNLKLHGTFATGDETLSHAIISDDNGGDKVYFIRDSLPGGALLHEVYPDRVILNRAGTLEALRLPRVSELQGGMPTAGSSPPFTPDMEDAGSVQQLMQAEPSTFTDILRPQPYMPNGELKGYRVYPGRDRRRFAALGLRPGDLVTDINGQPMNNLQGGMEVFRNLATAPQITVTIERNGSPMTLTLDSDQVIGQQENAE